MKQNLKSSLIDVNNLNLLRQMPNGSNKRIRTPLEMEKKQKLNQNPTKDKASANIVLCMVLVLIRPMSALRFRNSLNPNELLTISQTIVISKLILEIKSGSVIRVHMTSRRNE